VVKQIRLRMVVIMDKLLKKCVRALNRNEDVKNNLPVYADLFMHYSGSLSRLRLAMEYFMFYEMVEEGINPYVTSVKDTLDEFNRIARCFFEGQADKERYKEFAGCLLGLRNGIIDKMQVVTAYADCFVVYEYIFNRLQYRFDEMGSMPDDEEFIKNVINYVFGTKDNAVINENIRFITGQLPMRILRSRYFDIIRESVSVYKGSDTDALESFEYMFCTNAMLYKNSNMDLYFTEFGQVLDGLKGLDYDNIDEGLYRRYSKEVKDNASRLANISDLYMQLGKLVNSLYTVIIEAVYADSMEEVAGVAGDVFVAADSIIKGVSSLFTGEDSSVWKPAKENNTDKVTWLAGFFDKITGNQEKISGGLDVAEAVLDEVMEVQHDVIEELGMAEKFGMLKRMSLLNSGSIFAEFNNKNSAAEVTAQMADEVAARLIDGIKGLFKGSSRIYRRAVMANTLEKMPVFFNSPQEVADYISSSLAQCDDEAEKYASKEIIMDYYSQG